MFSNLSSVFNIILTRIMSTKLSSVATHASGIPSNTVILEEDFDEDYEPTSDEIREYAEALGMNVEVRCLLRIQCPCMCIMCVESRVALRPQLVYYLHISGQKTNTALLLRCEGRL